MVAPDGVHSIAMICACLVSGWFLLLSATDVHAAAGDRRINSRDVALLVADAIFFPCLGFGRECLDVARFVDFDLVMGSSGINAAPSAALP